jgi:NitT/TauT family transport system permease protein
MRAAKSRVQWQILVWRIALGVAMVTAWQVLVSLRFLDPFFFSRPSHIVLRAWSWITDGSIWTHLGITLTEAALAFVFGTTLGVAFGFVLGRVHKLAEIVSPYIQVANALPRIVLAPIFLLWFGLGIWSKVALGLISVFFVVFFNTFQGVREVDPLILNNARMLGASERQLVRHVILPSAMVWIFSSLHISIGFAMIAAVVGEYLGASRGIGYRIAQAEGVFDTTGVFAGMLVLAVVVLAVAEGVNRLERWLLRWKPGVAATRAPA